jgi:NAD(P)-dependent dehydrogenase (short-subunit alcohol dehydrogenase family)
VRKIKGATGNERIKFCRANLSSLREVEDLARRLISEVTRLDVLVNNAGIGFGRDNYKREISQDGYELRFAVNYLAPYLLTERLISVLRASAPARIVNVASVGQAPLDFDNIMLGLGYSGVTAYRQSKLATIAWTFDLAERLTGTGVTANALHPASLMPTKMVLEAGWQTMEMGSDHTGQARPTQLIVQDRFPHRARLRVIDAGVDQRPASAVVDQINVNMIESKRERQPNPEDTRATSVNSPIPGTDSRKSVVLSLSA